MEITTFIQTNREKAFLIGDYGTYRTQCSRQILSLRRKLKRTTPKNQKEYSKAPITAEDVKSDHAFAHLQILAAERSWAHAMSMKSMRDEDTSSGGITGSARKHIISRLHKAATNAERLVSILESKSSSGATDLDILEALAYSASLHGGEQFEKAFNKRYDDLHDQRSAWNACITCFSKAHIIYTALVQSTKNDVFREMLGGTVDPSIRYAAYQSRFPRTVAVSALARQHFPRDADPSLASLITSIHPSAFDDTQSTKAVSTSGATADVPTSITWRGRSAPIADAAVGQAIAATTLAVQALSAQLSASASKLKHYKTARLAAAYDPVLTAAQDTVDAIRHAIAELTKEGVPESDSRMQDLRVSDLAANYTLISWRVGRNRVLISDTRTLDDGLTFSLTSRKIKKAKRKSEQASADAMDTDGAPVEEKGPAQMESKSHALSRLRSRMALFDATLQSLGSVAALPGAARDPSFAAELDSKRAYFSALRCLNIGYAHSLLGKHREALALFSRAADLASSASPSPSASSEDNTASAPSLDLSREHTEALKSHVSLVVTRQRGLVALHEQAAAASSAAADREFAKPLCHRLGEYPAAGQLDLARLVEWPPRLEPVPVKPIFLDLAWNFIDYPVGGVRDAGEGSGSSANGSAVAMERGSTAAGGEKKKGWFGFGR